MAPSSHDNTESHLQKNAELADQQGSSAHWLKLAFTGAVVGVAQVLPGVSGSWVAMVLGVYDDIILGIAHFTRDIRANLKLFGVLALGLLPAVVISAKLLSEALERYNFETTLLVIGLILGSVPSIVEDARRNERTIKRSSWLSGIGAFVLMLPLVTFAIQAEGVSGGSVADATPLYLAYLVLVGFVSVATMLIPGVGGSLMLVVFGVYETIMAAIGNLQLAVLAPVALGGIFGLFMGARFMEYLFTHFRQQMYVVVVGLVAAVAVGYGIYIIPGVTVNASLVTGLAALAVGVGIAYLFGRLGSEDRADDKLDS